MTALTYISTYSATNHSFSTSLPALVISRLLDDSYPNSCEVVSHCSFNLHFLMISDVEYLYIYLLAICVFFGKCLLFSFLCPVFESFLFVCFFIYLFFCY